MKFCVLKNGQRPSPSEVARLVANGDFSFNYYVDKNRPEKHGEVWIELSADAERQGFEIVKKVSDEWISVDERLPEIAQLVLCCTPLWERTPIVNGIYLSAGYWHMPYVYEDIPGVTHWQPMPAPPRVQEVDNGQ